MSVAVISKLMLTYVIRTVSPVVSKQTKHRTKQEIAEFNNFNRLGANMDNTLYVKESKNWDKSNENDKFQEGVDNKHHGSKTTGHNWDRKPPFTTHTLRQLEILYHFSTNSSSQSVSLPSNLTWNQADSITTKRRRFPSCIIIGINKAGTLALLQFLTLHSQIVRPPVRSKGKSELNFFSSVNYASEGYQGYLKLMPLSEEGQITVEKSTAYFRSSSAPYRIHRFYNKKNKKASAIDNEDNRNNNGNNNNEVGVKLLLIVRNPVDRTVSEYLQRKLGNKITSVDNNKAYSQLTQSYPSFEVRTLSVV